jgi:hypothetical protein
MLSIDRDVLKAEHEHKKSSMGITTTDLVDTEDSEVDSRGLALVEEFQEQVVQITGVVVGEQADDDIDIPRKFTLYSENPVTDWSRAWYDHMVVPILTGGSFRSSSPLQSSPRPFLANNRGTKSSHTRPKISRAHNMARPNTLA